MEDILRNNFSIVGNFWPIIFTDTAPIYMSRSIVDAISHKDFNSACRISYYSPRKTKPALWVANLEGFKGFIGELTEVSAPEEIAAIRKNLELFPRFEGPTKWIIKGKLTYTWLSVLAAIAYSEELSRQSDLADSVWQSLYSLSWVLGGVESYSDSINPYLYEAVEEKVSLLKKMMNSLSRK